MVSKSLPQRVCEKHPVKRLVDRTDIRHWNFQSVLLYGDTRRGAFPSDVKAAVQYGENLQSLAVALNTVGAVSIKRTHEILSGVFNIPIATGTMRCSPGIQRDCHA